MPSKYTEVYKYNGVQKILTNGEYSRNIVKDKELELFDVAYNYFKDTYDFNVKCIIAVPGLNSGAVYVLVDEKIKFRTVINVAVDVDTGQVYTQTYMLTNRLEADIGEALVFNLYISQFALLENRINEIALKYSIYGLSTSALNRTTTGRGGSNFRILDDFTYLKKSIHLFKKSKNLVSRDQLENELRNSKINVEVFFYVNELQRLDYQEIFELLGEYENLNISLKIYNLKINIHTAKAQKILASLPN